MIRDMRKSDGPDLLRFLQESFPEEQAIFGFRPEGVLRVVDRVFRWDLRLMLGILAVFGRRFFRFFVVEEEGHVVATTLLSFASRAGYVSTVAVDPKYRRRGFARALLDASRTSTAKAHRPYIALDVLAENAPARALYEKIGYRPLRENRIVVAELAPGGGPVPAPAGLRRFTSADAKAVVAIAQRALPPEVAEVLPFHESSFRGSNTLNRALQSESVQWVLDRGRGPEAYLEASRSPAMDAANLSGPIVAETADPAAAAALVATAVGWCVERGARRIVCQVPVANARARAALEAGGFHEALSVWTLYRPVT